jgi:TRAP transporter TAXI family solute receptor
MGGLTSILSAIVCCAAIASSGYAMAKPQVRLSTEAERVNDGVVSIISGTPGGTYFKMAGDLALVLDDEQGLRVLPVLGKGAGQNAYDLLYLKGIDLAFVRTDTLEQLKQDPKIINPASQIVYVARLFNDELHVLARKDITDIKQLAGKKVSFDVKGSGTDYSGRSMFAGLGVDVVPVNVDQAAALEQLKRGELSAVVSVAAKPVSVLSGVDQNSGIHFLNVPYPASLMDRYYPSELVAADYPKLIPPGETVKTVAVGTILGAVNHPRGSARYERLKRFTEAFFRRYDEFQASPRHPKWREVSLDATVQGWTRFAPAQEWLDRRREAVAAKEIAQQNALRAEIQRFLEQKITSMGSDREAILREYLSWRAKEGRADPK